jgi:hypothetical protein
MLYDWLIGLSKNGWTNNELGIVWLEQALGIILLPVQ